MKGIDTIMSWEGIRIVFREQDKKGITDNMFRMEALCLAQAEISFKAGYEQHQGESNKALEILEREIKEKLDEERKAGIKEVVEWVEERKKVDQYGNHFTILSHNIASKGKQPILQGDWQDKLKEWE